MPTDAGAQAAAQKARQQLLSRAWYTRNGLPEEGQNEPASDPVE